MLRPPLQEASVIELVVEDRCITCGACARVCPNDVFDMVPQQTPTIARQEDCVTCYICEAYCPTDALYVAPLRFPTEVDQAAIVASGLLGSYRRALGWDVNPPGAIGVDPLKKDGPAPPPQNGAWGIARPREDAA
jgi:NAD-dependent dihydropyrimidine dehydrogenase PreA subunit